MFTNIDYFLDEYHSYVSSYQEFFNSDNQAPQYLKSCANIISFSTSLNLLAYDCHQGERIFLVVPSLLNSAEVLFINKSLHLIDLLRNLGRVYLVDWQEIKDPNFGINDYINELVSVINFLNLRHDRKIDVLGHCLGGNLVFSAVLDKYDRVNSVTMLTSPWDFSHFKPAYNLYRILRIEESIRTLDNIPQIYIQILFFLLYPDKFYQKIKKHGTVYKKQNNIETLFKIEKWLMSGRPLTKKTYSELTGIFIEENAIMSQLLLNKLSYPVDFNIPICQVLADYDHIAPEKSVLSLQKTFFDTKILRVESGHLSYLITPKINAFFSDYKNWLNGETR
jgi:polyhydroxyalkanoate synthase